MKGQISRLHFVDGKMDNKADELTRVAWLYYIEEQTQGQIADKLGVSRSTVIRLLQRARKTGLVTISINASTRIFATERDLEQHYGLEKIRIVPDGDNMEVQQRWLGQVAAQLVCEMVQDDLIMAVGWGRTLQNMTSALQGKNTVSGMQVVALIGGLYNAAKGSSPHEVAEQIGQFFAASTSLPFVPVYVKTPEIAQGLMQDGGVQKALNLARHASLAVFGLGALHAQATLITMGYINDQEQDFLKSQGAVGDILCRWIDANGQPVALPPTINPTGISLEEIKKIPQRIVVAGGETKYDIIRAALRGGYATHLIIDEKNAIRLLRSVDS